LISFNGGGNDIMRPKVTIEQIAERTREAVEQVRAAGIHMLLLSGGNPTRHIPLGDRIRERGDALALAVRERQPVTGVTFVDKWSARELEDLKYWSVDKLHLGAAGHGRVASNVLRALDVPVPDWGEETDELKRPGTFTYWREFV